MRKVDSRYLREVFILETPKGWKLLISKHQHRTLGRAFQNWKIIWLQDLQDKSLHILLHEITHARNASGKHNDTFYEELIRLDRKYFVDPLEIKDIEDYIPNALAEWYKEIGLRGVI